MRIIEWNCQGAFRKKNDPILSLNPDIIIVPECESKENLSFGKLTPEPSDFIWYGDSSNKGIGIFSYSDYKLELLPIFNPKFRYVIPIKVQNNTGAFLLFAIWAMDNKEYPEERYIGQIWNAINFYKNLLSLPVILVGDFNSNKIWDEKERSCNHSDLVNFLAKKEIVSVYHELENEAQGEEKQSTFHLYRKKEKPYHIDYFFTSKHFIKKSKLRIEKFENWIGLSDHLPLIFDTINPNFQIEINETFSSLIINQFKELNPETKSRFEDVISKMSLKAKTLDQLSNSIELRKKFTKSTDDLLQIDKIIYKLTEKLTQSSTKNIFK